jgi:colicin import membrane protein
MNTTTDNLPALALPEGAALQVLFQTENGLDPLIARIAAEVRSHVPDLTTAKGRDAVKSLAYKVARSKTMLDDAGKLLTDEQRKAINIVDAQRRRLREQLDALRDEARKPLDDWEAAEAERVAKIKARLARLNEAAPEEETDEAFTALIAKVEAVNPEDGSWGEYLMDATRARDAALKRLRDAAELSRLRREAAARAEADRIAEEKRAAEESERREREAEAERQRQAEAAEADRVRQEAERKANAQKNFADRLVEHCEELGRGRIGGIPQAAAILIHDLEVRILVDEEACGDHWPRVDAARLKALGEVKDAQAKAIAVAAEKAQREKDEAAERAAREAKARADEQAERDRKAAARREAELQRQLDEQKAETERAAQAERDRLAEQQRVSKAAADQRAADASHRQRIRDDIATSMNGFTDEQTAALIAEAIMAGSIPHVKAVL